MKEYDVVWRPDFWEYQVAHINLRKGYRFGVDQIDPKGPYIYRGASQRARDLTENWRRHGRHEWWS